MPSEKPPREIKSDLTLIRILDWLERNGPAGVSEIGKDLGIAKSTVHLHLNTLKNHEHIVEHGDKYGLGLKFLQYGERARSALILYRVARPKVDEMAETTGERIWCTVEEHGKAVYVYGASGQMSFLTPERVGERNELYYLAAGKAILAHLPEERTREILNSTTLTELTANTLTSVEALRKELAEIRERGVAYNREENMEGVHAIAAPVRGDGGHVHGAISIAGPTNRLMQEGKLDELGQYLLGAVNEIEVNIRNFDPSYGIHQGEIG